MSWPLSQDYNEAIQTPTQCFSDPELRQGEAVTNTLGLPVPCSGNFADVYAVVSGQRKWAVKCFTRQIPGLRERYAEISKYLQQVKLPFMVDFKFLEQGIRVRGQWYPILKMQWVEGMTLNQFVKSNLDKPQVLEKICSIWLKLATGLREANVAHGDLQHGNVLLVPGEQGKLSLRLVDYDGMCVPALELLKATEVGHPSYQHPQRLREGTYGLDIDRFSHLVIYTALRASAVGGRKLWDRFDNGDNLLFSQKDFENPTASPVFKELQAENDGETRKLAGALAEVARLPVQQTPLLETVLPSGTPPKTAAIPKQIAPKTAEPSSFVPPVTPERPRKKQGGKGVVAAVLIGCLVMAGAGIAAVALLGRGSGDGGRNETRQTAAIASLTSKPFSSQVTPSDSKGILVLENVPDQSEVFLDGKPVSFVSSKDLRLETSNGKHELKVAKTGFKPYVEQVQVTAGRTETRTIRLERDAPATKTSFIPLDIKGVATVASNRIFNQETILVAVHDMIYRF